MLSRNVITLVACLFGTAILSTQTSALPQASDDDYRPSRRSSLRKASRRPITFSSPNSTKTRQPLAVAAPFAAPAVQAVVNASGICTDGSDYQGPMHQCNMPARPEVTYASGPEFSKYLQVNVQPKFHIEAVAGLVDESADPIVSPGAAQSVHTHTVFGGANFGPNLTYDQTQQATCSSISIQADKSSYWQPTLYNQINGGFERLNVTGQRFYYIMHHWVIQAPAPLQSYEEDVVAFPPGFMMLIGDPMRKTFEDGNVGDAATSSWFCGNGETVEVYNGMPPKGCKNMKVSTMFPPCWNGKDLYLQGDKHMAWAVNFQGQAQKEGGWCPAAFPVRFPTILFESSFDLSAYNGDYNFVFANGDTTGYASHSDFFNGWDEQVLQDAIDYVYQKGDTPFNSVYTDTSSVDIPAFKNPTKDLNGLLQLAESCRMQAPLVEGGISKPSNQYVFMDKLPGCNPVWSSGPKPTC